MNSNIYLQLAPQNNGTQFTSYKNMKTMESSEIRSLQSAKPCCVSLNRSQSQEFMCKNGHQVK